MSQEQPLEFIGVKLPKDLAASVREAAWQRRLTLSEWVRQALFFALAIPQDESIVPKSADQPAA